MRMNGGALKRFGLVVGLVIAFIGTSAHADWPPPGSTGPDVIVGGLPSMANYPSVGTIDAFSVATTSCNIGTVDLLWQGSTNLHPVIGQNLYRLKDGRFEQVGMSWLKHGFVAVNDNTCTHPSLPACTNTGSVLGVGCSDPYSALRNGDQDGNGGATGGLGPHFDVNPHTGAYPFPYSFQGVTGNTIFKRLQVHHADLDPALNAGALYFVEGHYITPDDAAAGNGNNNASYRRATVSGSGEYTLQVTDVTERCQAGIRAWQDNDPTVEEVDVQVSGEGLFIVSAQATDIGGGQWHYEYAVQNMNSDRSAGSFSVPIDPTASVSNIGFHDVDYHSGEPYALTDWTGVFAGSAVTWSTDDFGTDPDANALRWSTLFNFRFDADVPPITTTVTIGLFKPGSPTSVDAGIVGPADGPLDCNNNGVVDEDDIANSTSADCNGNRIPDECEAPCNLTSVPVAVGLGGSPVFVVAPADDFDRLFIVQQNGQVRILDLNSSTVLGADFLDISGLVNFAGERGLFSLAFHPNYALNGLFYINYTNLAGNTVIAQYSVSGDPDLADGGSAVILRTISQDFANHNGGQLQFGPDGMLYIGMGDGGSGDDPFERAQDDGSLLGKMLRLDVDNPPTYIPPDNPASMPLPEVWAKGLRNPWRFSFDRLTGDLYIADVGQDSREEIDFQPASSSGGENYGWDCREGFTCAGGDPGDVGCSCA
ncbi:MAG: PQQ-dependent sugar dehydrogenase, partial [Planctomycetota bacterium]|nr:PQQ-dependent sugar dehydrogenase [Planctomycetota bacterium]